MLFFPFPSCIVLKSLVILLVTPFPPDTALSALLLRNDGVHSDAPLPSQMAFHRLDDTDRS